jgi:Na+-transporting NADH:ubiquinone oxidoreductase subunit NqrD
MAVAVLALVGPAAGIAVADPDPDSAVGGVLAQEVVLAQAESVDVVLANIRNWIMGIATGLATVFITIGAVRYMSAGGDLGEVEKAKTAFRSAAFGYALALLTPLVLSVLRDIVGAG